MRDCLGTGSRRQTGGHNYKGSGETFEGDGYVHSLGCGDSLMEYTYVKPMKLYTFNCTIYCTLIIPQKKKKKTSLNSDGKVIRSLILKCSKASKRPRHIFL